MFVLGVIPARGGSKQIPGKNIRLLAGRPLIAHTIDTARASRGLGAFCVTTDSEAIAAVARDAGTRHVVERPADLATDTAPIVPAVRHAVETYERATDTAVDAVALLFPTFPLRTVEDLDGALSAFIAGQPAQALTTMHEVDSRTDYYLCRIEGRRIRSIRGEWPPSPNRQDFPPLYLVEGAIDVCTRTQLFTSDKVLDAEPLYHIVPGDRAIDIDTEADWHLAEALLATRNPERKTPT